MYVKTPLKRRSVPKSVRKQRKKARTVNHWSWQIGPSFVHVLTSFILSFFFVFAPATAMYHEMHMDHIPDHGIEMVKLKKSSAFFREDELLRFKHR